MTSCSYCGGEVADGQSYCPGCGTDQSIPDEPVSDERLATAENPEPVEISEPVSIPEPVDISELVDISEPMANPDQLEYPESVQRPRELLIDLRNLPDAFRLEEGFSRPDWEVIGRAIKEHVDDDYRNQAWCEAALQWLIQLRDELGGNYHVTESAEFFLLCALDKRGTDRVHAFVEQARQAIREQLQDVALRSYFGKHVILLFAESDDYYQYQAPNLRPGVNVASGGVFLGGGYLHIALPYQAGQAVRPTLAHELTHNCLAHLPLPPWLNEGVAVRVEQRMTRPTAAVLDRELAQRHRAFWTEETIQEFWAGTSFFQPNDPQALSYSLAEILVHLLVGNHEQFLEFLRHAHYDDAGQTAALDCLGKCLGDIAGEFLGPGKWRPSRKALTECWQRAGWEMR